MIIVDATNLIAGRLASKVAKTALLGEEIHIINSERAVMTGNPIFHLDKALNRYKRGTWAHGPIISRRPHSILKRMIRGMLPYRKANGAQAFKNIKCYIGTPAEFESKNITTYPELNISTVKTSKYVTIGRISQHLGGRQ